MKKSLATKMNIPLDMRVATRIKRLTSGPYDASFTFKTQSSFVTHVKQIAERQGITYQQFLRNAFADYVVRSA